MSRPSKFTPDRVERILTALRAGNTRMAAAAYAGVHRDTLADWMARHSAFSADVQKAEADAEVRHVANIAKAAQDGNWTASAWWLERRRHQDWGKVDRVEVNIRREAERLADELGLDATEILAEAERIASGAR